MELVLIIGLILVSLVLINKVNKVTQIQQEESLPNLLQESNEFNDHSVLFYTDTPACLAVRKQEFEDCIYAEGQTVRIPFGFNICPENPNFDSKRKRDIFYLDLNPNCIDSNNWSIKSYTNGSSIYCNEKFLEPDLISNKVTLNGSESVSWKCYSTSI